MIPCKECISFVLCKIRIKEMDSPDITIFSQNIECKRIKEFIDYIDSPEFHQDENRVLKNMKAINKARDVFDLPSVMIDYNRIP